eukprot:scaffold134159_cov63-Phaeocystis_antarctica.AAC.1
MNPNPDPNHNPDPKPAPRCGLCRARLPHSRDLAASHVRPRLLPIRGPGTTCSTNSTPESGFGLGLALNANPNPNPNPNPNTNP